MIFEFPAAATTTTTTPLSTTLSTTPAPPPSAKPINPTNPPFRRQTIPSVDSTEAITVQFRRNPLARRYRLYVDRDGHARMTIPRRGTLREARAFVERHTPWLRQQLERARHRQQQLARWLPGRVYYLRGVLTRLEWPPDADPLKPYLQFGSERIALQPSTKSHRPDYIASVASIASQMERHLRQLASVELIEHTTRLAGLHQTFPRKVTVRNQRSRWGSCSARKTISLNWRLIQVPPDVRDYIIIHELMHLVELNHSSRYWKRVEAACPEYQRHEAWLRRHEPEIL